jgi:hypothetical protein
VSAQLSSVPLADNPLVPQVEKNTVASADFKSDGCTLWFDGNFQDCCIQHDLDYWNWYKTGGWRGRLRADNRLFTCIAGKGFFQKGMAPFMWLGVRIFGSPLFPAQKGNVIYNTSKKVIRFFRKGAGQTSNKGKATSANKAVISRNLKTKSQSARN